MLSNEQELALLESLAIPREDQWLSLLYLSMCKKVLLFRAPAFSWHCQRSILQQ